MANIVPRSRDYFESPFRALQREMDSLFRSFADESGGSLAPFPTFQYPATDFTETPESFLLRAELAGLDAKDVDIQVSGDMLTMRGEKREEVKRDNANVHFTERRYGQWQRSFRLPASADPTRVEARMTNGVLEVSIGKRAEAKPKSIPVKTN